MARMTLRHAHLRPALGLRLASIVLVAYLARLLCLWADAADARESGDPVEIAINQQGFAIPSDYIASLARESDGSVQLVRLTMFWPTMEPLANRVPQKLELPGPQGINALLRKRPHDGYQMLHAAIKLGWIDKQDEVGPLVFARTSKIMSEGDERRDAMTRLIQMFAHPAVIQSSSTATTSSAGMPMRP